MPELIHIHRRTSKMFMRKLVQLVLWLTVPCVLLQAQSSPPTPKLIHRYELGCGYSCAQEAAADLGGFEATKLNGRVAIRFCSKEPMPLALTTAAAAYGYVISILEGSYGFTPDRILFLRSDDCIGSHKAVTATEFWAIPKGASLPTSIESFTSSEVKSESIPGNNSGAIGTRNYKMATQQLIKKLRTKEHMVGIVLGYYYDKPSELMKRRLREVLRVLERSGLQQDRYFVLSSPWSGEHSIDPLKPEPVYPSFFIVEVAKGAKQTTSVSQNP
jgi:hypothetical protein